MYGLKAANASLAMGNIALNQKYYLLEAAAGARKIIWVYGSIWKALFGGPFAIFKPVPRMGDAYDGAFA
jgi:hypothetical protein